MTCPHCGYTSRFPCDHTRRLAKLSKAEHDAILAAQERQLERARFHGWLREDHPARALAIIGRHAAANQRRFTF